MARKSYLWNTQKELIKIGGLGDFGANNQPLEVPEDVAHQYSTKEAKDAGWMVTWQEDVPARASAPTPPATSPSAAPTPPTPPTPPMPASTPTPPPVPTPPATSPSAAPTSPKIAETPKAVEPPKAEVHK